MSSVKVWDLPVRLFHWSLVVAFTVAFISGENDLWIHDYAGYAVLALILLRIVWGFFGSEHARFSNFIYSPHTVLTYLRSLFSRKPQHYLGHNPAGGWMVIALLVALLISGISGWRMDAAEEQQPAAAASTVVLDNEHAGTEHHAHEHKHAESAWHDIHEIFVHVSLLLVFAHILGVIVSSYLHREALIKAMITGFKKRQ